jgi:hypothetical protein
MTEALAFGHWRQWNSHVRWRFSTGHDLVKKVNQVHAAVHHHCPLRVMELEETGHFAPRGSAGGEGTRYVGA